MTDHIQVTPEGDGVVGMGERVLGNRRGEGKVDSHHLSRPASGAEGHLKVAEEPVGLHLCPADPFRGQMSAAEPGFSASYATLQ